MKQCKGLFMVLLAFLPLLGMAQKKQITVADLYQKGTFYPQQVRGFNSMKDGRFYTEIDTQGNLVKKSFKTGETEETLIRSKDLKTKNGRYITLNSYEFGTKEEKVIIRTQIHSIYRRSYTTIPYVYNLKTKELKIISSSPVLHPTLSPDGEKMAYVRDNNLFYKDLKTGKEIQITKDGEKNAIINGNCDWVYEEEFSFTRAFEWSPSSDKIAYYRFDERKVPEYSIPFYTDTSSYPTLYTYKYPKAGDVNSVVSIHVYDLKNVESNQVDVGENPDQYIPRIKWTKDNNFLSVYRLNRLQNHLEMLLYNTKSKESNVIYTDEAKWYISETLYDDLFFLEDGKHFIIVNESDGWQHAYLYNMKGKQLAKLTPYDWDLDKIVGIDQRNKQLYFTAAYPNPKNRQLFVVDFKGKHLKQLTKKKGWHDITFNADNTFYLDQYSTLNEPPVYAIYNQEGESVRKLEDNSRLKKVMKSYDLSQGEFLKIPNRKGIALNAMILYPSDFDSTRTYPVLFMNYGGPGSQTVVNRWGGFNFWQQMLAEKGYIIVSVDNTGTGFRGAKFKKEATYLNLGWHEIHDQMDAARWLIAHHNYIDSSRIGHWGWSFGGFMSALAMTVGADVFHAAIAVAPVTNWKFYDNIYTERFMRTPQENAKGYAKTSPIKYADLLKGPFLMVHGTADDNVHFQNSMMLSEAFIQADKSFQQAYYPNKNHGIYGGNTRMQLYRKMTHFILKNL